MNYGFTENERVKFPAILHLLRLGYKYMSIRDKRINYSTNIFIDVFKDALIRINDMPIEDAEIESVMQEIKSMAAFNDKGKKFYEAITEKGINDLKLIDFKNIENNSFNVVTELTFGDKEGENFRPDIILLINGMPLAFLEVKKPDNDYGIQAEFSRMAYRLKHEDFKNYFNIVQVLAFSNNMDYPIITDTAQEQNFGSFYSTPNGEHTSYNYFREEQPITVNPALTEKQTQEVLDDNNCSDATYSSDEFQTNLDINRPCNAFCTSIFSKERLLFFLQYGILYLEDKKEKHIIRYSQYFAIKNMEARLNNSSQETKNGIIWHTQGSGKTALAAFMCKYLKDYYSKQEILTKFYFVVDRLDLANQANEEFQSRYFNTKMIASKDDFRKELKKTTAEKPNSITIVNIQKFEDDYPTVENEYGAKIQRIMFVDEAHRSQGLEFHRRLMLIDPNAVFIALTGTPLLSKSGRSTNKFGGYIHKYFYDKSIADGYTIPIKRETIQTIFKDEIKSNLEIELDSIQRKEIYESDDYIVCLGKYIERDYENTKIVNDDETVGGMVVCASKPQAEKLNNYFNTKTKIRSAMVLYDTPDNDKIAKAFKKTDPTEYDLLVVYQMLTTGYDARRLKRMYIMRNPQDHTLLQTISRVNRPYKAPNGKKYHYGYVIDFAGIEDNQNKALEKYKRELAIGLEDDEMLALDTLIIDINIIFEEYKKNLQELKVSIETENMEEFSIQLSRFEDKIEVKKIEKLLDKIYNDYVELLLSDREQYEDKPQEAKIKQMIRLTRNRLQMLRLIEKPVEVMSSSYLSNKEIIEILYEFMRTKTEVLDLTTFSENCIGKQIGRLNDAIRNNKNKKDFRLTTLEEEIRRILLKLEIYDQLTLEEVNAELAKIYDKVQRINEENAARAAKYDGEFGYVRAMQEFVDMNPKLSQEKIEDAFIIIKKQIDNIKEVNRLIYKDKITFINGVKSTTTSEMIKSRLYQDLELKNNFDKILSLIYVNISLMN